MEMGDRSEFQGRENCDGIGQAQVRTKNSVENTSAVIVAC